MARRAFQTAASAAIVAILILIAHAAIFAQAPAEEDAVYLQIDQPGVFRFDPETKTLKRLRVIRPDTTADPDPDPEPTSLTAKVKRWADEVNDPQTRRLLGISYGIFVDEQFENPEIVKQRMAEVLNRVIEQRGVQAEWQPFVIRLGAEIDTRIARGQLQTVEDYQAMAKQIADGLLAGQAAAIDLTEALELVRMVLPIIRGEQELTIDVIVEVALRVLKMFGDVDEDSARSKMWLIEVQRAWRQNGVE